MGGPESSLLKRDASTDKEESIVRQPPALAWDLLSPITYLRPAVEIPYCHHENWDGSGYPRGLKSEQIPIVSRIFAVADAWGDLRTEKPERTRLSFDAAQQHLRERSGTWFDPRVVETLFTILEPEMDERVSGRNSRHALFLSRRSIERVNVLLDLARALLCFSEIRLTTRL